MSEKDASHEERLRELRERLYSRAQPPAQRERRELQQEQTPVPHAWSGEGVIPAAEVSFVEQDQPERTLLSMSRPKRTYRIKLVIGGLIFFVAALLLSGSYLLFKRPISGDNIAVDVTAPFVVGGGEELDLQITLSNKNAVPIEAATLIVEYPFGTQSAEEEGKELFRERKPLAPLNPGEVVNIPLRARLFGEENEEKTVLVSIEYRVGGSNAIFYKQAEPIRVKISSSPVVLFVENVDKTSSGQDVELEVSVTSNSPQEIADLLVKAEYPQGFDYTDAVPAPVSGQDTWSVTKLKPQEKKIIKVRGALMGKQSEQKVFRFSVGVPNERDRFSLASVFSSQREEILIEEPFLDVGITVNGDKGERPVIGPDATTLVSIKFTNTLSTTLYEGKIVADLSGNGLNESQVQVSNGFYDSSTNTITWDQNTTESLRTLRPGESSTVGFNLTPLPNTSVPRTPQITFTVNAEGNRVTENQASERLTATAARTIKVESAPELISGITYSVGAFTNSGPVPPVAEEVTTYTMHLGVQNTTNALTDGVVTMTLPVYVTWLDLTTAGPTFSYNPQTRQVAWKVGDLDAGASREVEFQFSFKPSLSQVGQVVTLIEGQRFQATDRFTGTTITDTRPALTTSITSDPQYGREEGRVIAR